MKRWPVMFVLLGCAFGAQASYLLVHSPGQKTDVFVENAERDELSRICQPEVALRLVTQQPAGAHGLDGFLRRVSKLVARLCPATTTLTWRVTTPDGTVLQEGDAARAQQWALHHWPALPIATPDPADDEPVSPLRLLSGCQIRTYLPAAVTSQALFIADSPALRCQGNFLYGSSPISVTQQGKTHTLTVNFWQGYPLRFLAPSAADSLLIRSVNRQRMVLSTRTDDNSLLLLPFNPLSHSWDFNGTLVVAMPRRTAADPARLQPQLQQIRQRWQPFLTNPLLPLTFRLVEKLAPDQRDPGGASYLTLTH